MQKKREGQRMRKKHIKFIVLRVFGRSYSVRATNIENETKHNNNNTSWECLVHTQTQQSIGSKTPSNANRTIRAVQITIQTHKYSTRASLRMHVCVYVSNSFAVMRFTSTVTSLIFCCCSPTRAPFEPPPKHSRVRLCILLQAHVSSLFVSLLFSILFSFLLLFLFTRSVRRTLFDLIWIVMERQSRRVRSYRGLVK